MFDIIGKVVDVNMRTSASGLFSWKEIVVRECSAEGVIDSEKEVNDIPLMFDKNFSDSRIVKNAWVKARFRLASRSSYKGQLFLEARGVLIKVLYDAKPLENSTMFGMDEDCEAPF